MVQNFISDLLNAGLTERQIAAGIGRSQPSVNRMRHGKQGADYQTGKRLEELHRQHCAAGEQACTESGKAAA